MLGFLALRRNEGTLDWRAGTPDRLILQGTGLGSSGVNHGLVECGDPKPVAKWVIVGL